MDKKMESFLEEIIEETKNCPNEICKLDETEALEWRQINAYRKQSYSKHMYLALLIIFAAVFLLGAIYLVGHLVDRASDEKQYEALESMRQDALNNPSYPVPTPPTGNGTTAPSVQTMLNELRPLYELNQDLVGYVSFPYENLNLQYPVVQHPSDDSFYKDYDFYGEKSDSGCPHVVVSMDVYKPSDHVIIYGHNLMTGGMFNKLLWYQDKEYWEEHQTFSFDTLYEHHTYRIFAVFKTGGTTFTSDGSPWGYPFQLTTDFASEEEFNKFIADVKGAAFEGENAYKGESMYDTGITPQYGDKILTLSTCEYTVKDPDGKTNGRWVVMAYRIN